MDKFYHNNFYHKTIMTALLAFVLLGCGNKGPLVLPDAVDDNKVEKAKRELTN